MSTQHLRDAQDYTLRLKRRLISTGYQQNLLNHTPNSNGNYLSARIGARECVLPLLDLSPPSILQNEGTSVTTTYTYTVTRIGTANCAVSWAVTGSGVSPAVASDFVGGVLPQGMVNFASGGVTRSIVVQVVGDATIESNKQFTVTLSNPIGATIGVGTATGTITNDDFPVLNLSPASITQNEGNSGTTPYTYTVSRTGALACSVSWAVTGSGSDPATAGDFSGSVLPSGTLSFLIGDTTKTITINVTGDATVEATKQFTVTLSSPVSATIGTGTAIGIITSDDLPVLDISPPNITQDEGNGTETVYQYTVTRTGLLACSVDWSVTGSGSDPAIPVDFGGSFPSGTLNFGIGDLTLPIEISVYGNETPGANREFTVTLSNPVDATIGTGTATGTITDIEVPVLDISPPNINLPEGNSGTTPYTYTVTRSFEGIVCSVDWAVTGSGSDPATAGDFGGVFPSGTLSFSLFDNTEVIVIDVVGNTDVQTTREFTVTLSNPVDATIGTGTATGTITEDDP